MLGLVAACLVKFLGALVRLLNDGVQRRLVDFALNLVMALILWFNVAVAVALHIDVILPKRSLEDHRVGTNIS